MLGIRLEHWFLTTAINFLKDFWVGKAVSHFVFAGSHL